MKLTNTAILEIRINARPSSIDYKEYYDFFDSINRYKLQNSFVTYADFMMDNDDDVSAYEDYSVKDFNAINDVVARPDL